MSTPLTEGRPDTRVRFQFCRVSASTRVADGPLPAPARLRARTDGCNGVVAGARVALRGSPPGAAGRRVVRRACCASAIAVAAARARCRVPSARHAPFAGRGHQAACRRRAPPRRVGGADETLRHTLAGERCAAGGDAARRLARADALGARDGAADQAEAEPIAKRVVLVLALAGCAALTGAAAGQRARGACRQQRGSGAAGVASIALRAHLARSKGSVAIAREAGRQELPADAARTPLIGTAGVTRREAAALAADDSAHLGEAAGRKQARVVVGVVAGHGGVHQERATVVLGRVAHGLSHNVGAEPDAISGHRLHKLAVVGRAQVVAELVGGAQDALPRGHSVVT